MCLLEYRPCLSCVGLLEYQAMPFLRDVAHDGVCVHLVIYHKWCGPSGQAAWTVHHMQNHTLLGHSPPDSQTGRRVGPALQPSASLVTETDTQKEM
jgi:hypothetical protein